MTGDLAAQVARLGRQVDLLEAESAVHRLKRRYAQLCDEGYDGAALAALFAPDGSWSSNHDGPFTGRAAIADFLATVGADRFSWAAHYLANGSVDVDLDAGTAAGRWELVQLATDRRAAPGPAGSVVATGTYRDRFVCVDGAWLIASLELRLHRLTDLVAGW
ncbi:nuclear transport factor 2 family protein [Nocardioides sp. BYT-33-1]|uniref:nuclear transport factor 2 family protein n=1 Tax=Nocardioides sp. BYT-33-1 TaxID=3416952 RepID=UPI003F535183